MENHDISVKTLGSAWREHKNCINRLWGLCKESIISTLRDNEIYMKRSMVLYEEGVRSL